MRPNGCLIVVEKVLGEDSVFNRQFIKYYYDMKRRHGYSEMEISQKREALENVLIPYKLLENRELLLNSGFRAVDVFFKWYNFAGIIAIGGGQMMVRIGNFLFRFRNGLFPLSLLMLLLPGRDLFADPLKAVALGFCVALLGQLVRGITIGFEYIIRGGRNKRVYAENLVTEGFYRLCRNPMYVGNLLIVAGLAVASNSLTCLLS